MPGSKSKSRKTNGPTLLLAEDDVIVRLVMAEHLRACGLNVIEAASAQEAKMVLLANVTVDIMLADAQLAGPVSGFALAQWVRKNRPGLAVILTGTLKSKAEAAHEMCERAAKQPARGDPATLHDRIVAMTAERERRSRKPSTASLSLPRLRDKKRWGA